MNDELKPQSNLFFGKKKNKNNLGRLQASKTRLSLGIKPTTKYGFRQM